MRSRSYQTLGCAPQRCWCVAPSKHQEYYLRGKRQTARRRTSSTGRGHPPWPYSSARRTLVVYTQSSKNKLMLYPHRKCLWRGKADLASEIGQVVFSPTPYFHKCNFSDRQNLKRPLKQPEIGWFICDYCTVCEPFLKTGITIDSVQHKKTFLVPYFGEYTCVSSFTISYLASLNKAGNEPSEPGALCFSSYGALQTSDSLSGFNDTDRWTSHSSGVMAVGTGI